MTHAEEPLSVESLDEVFLDEADSGSTKRRPGLLARLAGWIGISAPIEEKLQALNQSIQLEPEAPTAYVLRGEIFVKKKQYHLAKADFERAIVLTDEMIHSARWGVVAQAMRDRALEGLANKQIARIDGDS
ncbi:MAG: hypothetical protein KC615_05130 [Anaerolineae bacterium]|nr:hypothetical protein [Anaerolineae bacterium]